MKRLASALFAASVAFSASVPQARAIGSISELFVASGSSYVLDGANILDASVTDAKLVNISASKVTGLQWTGSLSGDVSSQNSGNVGIGVAAPLSKLSVGGTIESTSGGVKFPDGTLQTTASVGSSLWSASGSDIRNTNSGGVYIGSAFYSATGTSIFIGGGGQSNTGFHNAAQGYNALYRNASGYGNAAQGSNALYHNASGYGNAAQGFWALTNNVAGSLNSAHGAQALYSNISGNYNSAQGAFALLYNRTGDSNSAYGYEAGSYGISMSGSTFLGYKANSTADGISNSMALGANATVTKSNQVVIGDTAVSETLLNGNVGIYNTAPGYPLSVGGFIESKAGGYRFPDGTVQSTAASTVPSQWTASGSDIRNTNSGGVFVGDAFYTAKGSDLFIGGGGRFNSPVVISGNGNAAQGMEALKMNTTGMYNSAQGYYALNANSAGNYNSAQGAFSLSFNTASENTAQGYMALYSNTTGPQNSAQGTYALYSNTAGFNNSAQGTYALYSNTTGSYNSAYGARAGYGGLTKSYSTFLGYQADSSVDGVTNSMALGNGATVTRSDQVVVGNAAVAETLLNGNVGIGLAAPAYKLSVAGVIHSSTGGVRFPDGTVQTTANGLFLWSASGSDIRNTNSGGVFVGNALISTYKATGSNGANIFIGGGGQGSIGGGMYFGSHNTSLGDNSLMANTTGHNNTAIGEHSLNANTTGNWNSGIGVHTLYLNTTGHDNTAGGASALYANTIGNYNTAHGSTALYVNTTGDGNSAMGYQALYSNTTGDGNSAYGYLAGTNGTILKTMSNSTFVGSGANSSVDGVTNSMALGNGATVTKSNQVVVGNAAVTETLLQGNVGIDLTAPAYPLSVAGIVYSSTGGFRFPDGTVQTTSASALKVVIKEVYTSTAYGSPDSISCDAGYVPTGCSNLNKANDASCRPILPSRTSAIPVLTPTQGVSFHCGCTAACIGVPCTNSAYEPLKTPSADKTISCSKNDYCQLTCLKN